MRRHVFSSSKLSRRILVAADRTLDPLKYQIEQLEQRVLLAANLDALELYSTSPAVFVENKGQWADASVKFVHQGKGASIALTDAGPVFQLSRPATPVKSPSLTERDFLADPVAMLSTQFSVHFDNSNVVSPAGMDRSESAFNYFLGDKSTWRSNVGGFEKVEYPNLYDGIDLQTWGKKTHLKYEFHVAPGADYRQVQVSYEGINGLSIDRKGQLHVKTKLDELIDDKPFVYQDIDGKQVEIASKFVLVDKDTYRFEISGKVDPSRELVIDPSLAWGSYLGGSGTEWVRSLTIDDSGNAWITGQTNSTNFPTLGGFDVSHNGGDDVFVSKVSGSGQLLWSSFLGGSGQEWAYGIAVDTTGNAILTGQTDSTNFPTPGGFDTSQNGGNDVFVTKVSGSGQLLWSSFLGGSGADDGKALAVDNSGNIFLAGGTGSTDFPTSGGFDTGFNGDCDVFVTKVSGSGQLLWSSYLGGVGYDIAYGIAVDITGNAVFTGNTGSTNFPTPGGGFDPTYNGGRYDAIVAKVSGAGQLLWSSYLGGNGTDYGRGIAVDTAGNAILSGSVESGDFPTSGGFDTGYNGLQDAFVTKVSGSGQLIWSSYFGGSGSDEATDVCVDAEGNAILTGITSSADLPTPGGLDLNYNGGTYDAFVTKVSGSGQLVWSSYLGGSGGDDAEDIALDGSGNAWIGGFTDSANFPTGGGFDTTYNGGTYDAFVAKVLMPTLAADAGGSYGVTEGNSLQLNASGTLNPGSRPLTYAWDLNGDSVFTDATGVTPTLSWSQLVALGINDGPATWNNVRVRVTDDLGGSSTSPATTLTVQDTPPTVTITGNATVAANANYTLNLSASDPGSDTISGWQITWGLGDVQTITGNPSSVTHVYTTVGSRTITATATNEDGTFASNALSLDVEKGIDWASYLGGSGTDSGYDIATDGTGNVWIVGTTSSEDFPGGGFDPSYNGGVDGFVAKVNANGTLDWCSYLGGSGFEAGMSVAIDGLGNAWLTGYTYSTDFPGGGFDSSYNGGVDAFVAKVNANGTLAWCSYLGGTSDDRSRGIALDGTGSAWLTGYTDSTNFPGGGFDTTYNGSQDAFVAKVNANGTLAWGSYLGGSQADDGWGIAVDDLGDVWVAGTTSSTNFPGGGFDSTYDDSGGLYINMSDAFVAKINANGTLAWGSYLGGMSEDQGCGIAMDVSGNAWIVGNTVGTDFFGGGFDSTGNGREDAFIAKVNANGTLAWGSYLGGSASDLGYGITVDRTGNAWVTGYTLSTDFPGGGFDTTYNGNQDAFVAKVNANGTLAWGSYLGGLQQDFGWGIAADNLGNAWVTGFTQSRDFPAGNGFDRTYNDNSDAFIAKIVSTPIASAGGPYTLSEGNAVQLDGSGTQDPSNRPLTYAWDLNNDNNFTDASGVSPTLTWNQLVALGINDGPVAWNNIRVRVSDDLGNVSTSPATTLSVQDTPPSVIISGTGFINAGASYSLNLSATDPGSDTVSSWTITWAPGDVQTVTGNPSSVSHVFNNVGYYLISAAATNEDGTFASNSLPVNVGPIQTGATIVFVSNVSLVEGDTPGVQSAVQITRSGDWTDAISIDYATANGSAIAGTDYQSKSGTLILESGQASMTVYVPITSNLIAQPDRSFTFTISNVRAVSGGAISFAPHADFSIGNGGYGVASGDLNGDGRPDLAVSNWFEHTVSILINDAITGASSPSFLAQQKFTTGLAPRGITIADINGDGRPDVLTGNRDGNSFSVLLNNTTLGSSTASFQTKVDFTAAAAGVHAIDTADLNGDGRLDVALTLQDADRVCVFLNTTPQSSMTATFGSRVDLITQQYPWRLELADVTDDGRPDIVLNYAAIQSFSIFPNTTLAGASSVNFAAREDWATSSTGTWPALAVGDVNGDGVADVVTGEQTGLFFNTHRTPPLLRPYTNFAARQSLGVSTVYWGVSGIVDLNTDGKSDLVVSGAGQLNILQNRTNPSGSSLALGVNVPVPLSNNPVFLTTADYNGDGRADLAAIDHGNGFVNVLLNTTVGRASLPQFVGSATATGSFPHAATAGDLNADGKPDLVTANQGDGTISVLVNNSVPAAASPLFLPKQDFLAGSFCVWTAIADFNLDNKPDVVAANAAPNTVSVLLNATSPQSSSIALSAKADFLTGNRPRMVAVGDFNLDGRPDIVTPNSWGNTVAVLVNATTPGSPTLAFAAKQEFLAGTGAVSVAVGDLNGDGLPDLVVANETANSVSVLINATTPGSASLAFTATQNFAVGAGPRSVALADINSDGKLDIVTANHNAAAGTTASVLLNLTGPGSGTPSFASQQIVTSGSGIISVWAGDVSGDGVADIVAANFVGDAVAVLRNLTAPGASIVNFDTPVNLGVGNSPIFVGAADLTLDGRPDIIAANFDAASVSVLSNTPVSVSQAVATVTIIDDDAVPQVTASSYRFETAPQHVEFTFSKNVGASIDLSDLSVVRLRDNVQIAPVGVSYDAMSNTARWNLPAGMDNGNYLAVVNGIGVFDSAGRQLPGPATLPFYILWGDANRDRKVNTLDFNLMAYNFGGSGKIFSQGDFNLDTQVDSVDFGIYLANYGTVIVAPGPLPSAMQASSASAGYPLFAGVAVTEAANSDGLIDDAADMLLR